MSMTVDCEKLQMIAKELAKGIKSEKDLSDLSREIVKMTVEAALGAEMEEHLGYAKRSSSGRNSDNSRNGSSHKTLKDDHGEAEIETPRDRNDGFNPQFVKKV